MSVFSVLLALVGTVQTVSAEDAEHRHHVAAAVGGAAHDNKTSAYIGVDYMYRFSGSWAAGVFLEEVSGDFDVRAWGVTVGRYFDNGWKLGAGIGAEYKIKKDKTLSLIHIDSGYDWHFGNWTVGPTATIDLIEGGEHTYYLGAALGYGF